MEELDASDSIAFILGVSIFCVSVVMFGEAEAEIRKRLPLSFQEGISAKIATNEYAYDSNIPRKTQTKYFVCSFIIFLLAFVGELYVLIRGYYTVFIMFILPLIASAAQIITDYPRFKQNKQR